MPRFYSIKNGKRGLSLTQTGPCNVTEIDWSDVQRVELTRYRNPDLRKLKALILVKMRNTILILFLFIISVHNKFLSKTSRSVSSFTRLTGEIRWKVLRRNKIHVKE